MRFAIIGAGMAGLSCAEVLRAERHDVALFDKGRGPGGRMATRRLETPLGEVPIDHGAQYFTARDPAFRALTQQWQAAGLAVPWPEIAPDAWVATPTMNAVIRHMARTHEVAWASQIGSVVRAAEGWWLYTHISKLGPYDAVISAVPAEQAAPILSLHDFAMARAALLARSQPCWTAMFVFDRPTMATKSIVRDRGIIAWATCNSAKPGRSGPEAWVVQGNGEWSASHIEDQPEAVWRRLLAELRRVSGQDFPSPVVASAHRWRFALSAGTGLGALWNPSLGLGACGDWLLGPRVECAWLSGRRLADRILHEERVPAAARPTVQAQG